MSGSSFKSPSQNLLSTQLDTANIPRVKHTSNYLTLSFWIKSELGFSNVTFLIKIDWVFVVKVHGYYVFFDVVKSQGNAEVNCLIFSVENTRWPLNEAQCCRKEVNCYSSIGSASWQIGQGSVLPREVGNITRRLTKPNFDAVGSCATARWPFL